MKTMANRDQAATPPEAEVQARGRALWERIQHGRPGLFVARFWEGELLDGMMRDPALKADLLRLVDVLPQLPPGHALTEHLEAYLRPGERELPWLLGLTARAARLPLLGVLAGIAMRRQTAHLARRFIAGTSPEEALPRLRALHLDGFGFTADLLGEAVYSEAEAAVYRDRYRGLIDDLAAGVAGWPAEPLLATDHLGPLPLAQISLKVSALAPNLAPEALEADLDRLSETLLPLLLAARERQVAVTFDMEHWELHELTLALFRRLAMHPELRAYPHLGLAIQAYLGSAAEDVERLIALAGERGTPFGVRLVKGAYWDAEVVRARQRNLLCPVLRGKGATDLQFERLTGRLLANSNLLRPAFGTHNLRSIAAAMTTADTLGVPRDGVEFQMLYGMAEPERQALREEGYRVRVYSPVGELLPGMAYLARRLLENTANQGFLRLTHHEHRPVAELLAPPVPQSPHRPEPDGELLRTPPLDFTRSLARREMAEAIEAVRDALPLRVQPVLGGRARQGGAVMERPCPSHPELTVSRVELADRRLAEEAVEGALAAFPGWRDRSVETRAALLENLAERLAADRCRLAALAVWEVGKPWAEADADVAEAIDFCRYYAHQARQDLSPRRDDSIPGETNLHLWQGRGPAAIVAPWNFPLAILCGMTTAALAAGNPVIIKPAEQASAVGAAFHRHLLEAGCPAAAAQFLPGLGEVAGKCLVEHPQVALIAFTGSRAVGLEIMRAAAERHPGQPQVKRVLCELGGKNAIVVDEDADLDETVGAVLASAFGLAGQKCSACSRLIVVGKAAAPLLQRLTAASERLPIGPAEDPASRIGPVVDLTAFRRLRALVENPGPGVVVHGRGKAPEGGWFVEPLILEVESPDHPLMQDELFGPVITLCRVKTFREALAVANGTDYALTGGVFSRHPRHLEQASREFQVGNLYLNRGITGAIVGRQPFGGFRLSGTGVKAGGPGYLRWFADARTVTENTIRHGVAPEVLDGAQDDG